MSERDELRKGETASAEMFLPRRTPHTFRSLGDDGPGGLFQCCVPGGMEHYFAAIADSDAETERGRALRCAAGERFGLRFPDDPRELLPGAEREPPYSVRPQSVEPRLDGLEAKAVPRLARAETAGRIALDELFVARGGSWRMPPASDHRVLYLLSGALDWSGAGGSVSLETRSTLVLPPGASGTGTGRGDSIARLLLLTVPAP